MKVRHSKPQFAMLDDTVEALVGLLRLEDGWDSYGARRVEPRAVSAGLHVLLETMPPHLPPPAVVPTSTGGVQFEWHTGGIDLEVEIGPSGDVSTFMEDQQTGLIEETDSTADLQPLVTAFAKLQQRLRSAA